MSYTRSHEQYTVAVEHQEMTVTFNFPFGIGKINEFDPLSALHDIHAQIRNLRIRSLTIQRSNVFLDSAIPLWVIHYLLTTESEPDTSVTSLTIDGINSISFSTGFVIEGDKASLTDRFRDLKLNSIKINRCQFKDKSTDLSQLLNWAPQAKYLTLDNVDIGGQGGLLSQYLKANQAIVYLCIEKTKLKEADVNCVLGSLENKPTLEWINIANNHLDDTHIPALNQFLIKRGKTKTLNLSGATFTANGIKSLVEEGFKQGKLIYLIMLDYCPHVDSVDSFMREIIRTIAVKKWVLQNSFIFKDTATKAAMENPVLQHFELCGEDLKKLREVNIDEEDEKDEKAIQLNQSAAGVAALPVANSFAAINTTLFSQAQSVSVVPDVKTAIVNPQTNNALSSAKQWGDSKAMGLMGAFSSSKQKLGDSKQTAVPTTIATVNTVAAALLPGSKQ